MSDVEKDLRQAQENIQTLVIAVTKLSVMMENAEKRHDSDIAIITEAVRGINTLQEKVALALNLEKDIAGVREAILELKGDIRTARHDLNTALNVLQAIPIMQKTLAEQGVKIEALETWRDEIKGAAQATGLFIKAMWAIFGAAVLAGFYFILKMFFASNGAGNNGGY